MVYPNGNGNKEFWAIVLDETTAKTIVSDLFSDREESTEDDGVKIKPKKSTVVPFKETSESDED